MTVLQSANDRQLASLFCYMNSPFYLQDERSIAAKLYSLGKKGHVDFDFVYDSIIDATRKGIVNFYNTYGAGVTDPALFDSLKNQYTKLDRCFPPSTLRQFLRHCWGNILVQRTLDEKVETECIGITDIKTCQYPDGCVDFILKEVQDIEFGFVFQSSTARSCISQ